MKNTPMFTISAALLLLLLPAAYGQQTLITDPKADFLANSGPGPTDQLFKLEADINHDGLPDVFLALSVDDKDTEEVGDSYSWILYIAQPGGGYIKAAQKDDSGNLITDGIVTFRKDAYFVGYIPEIKGYGLLTLDEGMAAKAKGPQVQLKAIVIVGNNAFQEVPVGKAVYDYAAAPLRKRFAATPTPPVQTLPAK